MFIVYDFIFIIFSLIYLPCLIVKAKFHQDFLQRFAFFKAPLIKRLKDGENIWIHAVSVGEVLAISSFINVLRKEFPEKRLVISTVTTTGNRLAKKFASANDLVIYFPLDLSFIVKRFINIIRPFLFITCETEIWPNLFLELKKNNIPIILINGRISDNSFKGYGFIKYFLKNILDCVNLFCMRSERDAQRIIELGAKKERVKITGNMKFDNTDYTDKKIDYTDYKRKLGLEFQEKLFVAGSTHPGEEKLILGAYQKLKNEFPELKLLIAPRHPERTPEIIRLIEKFNFVPIRISFLNKQTSKQANKQTVFILDTIGELLYFYNLADIVFVGGSLVKKGGHNIIEPAVFGKPIIFGPYMSNFQDIADLFLNNSAGIIVFNEKELFFRAKELLEDSEKRQIMGKNASRLVQGNRGSTERTLFWLRGELSKVK